MTLFSDLGLGEKVLKAVEDAGYTNPTPIQEKAIPTVLMGRDIIGIAQTGTGKTASFTLPMIEILSTGRARARMPRSLILCPTRELAHQVAENFETYGKHHKLEMALLIGGVSMADQEKKLNAGVDVLIATPGRLLDHFERGRILLHGIQVLVIDEADRMLDMGFIPDIEKIVNLMPPLRQTLLFSATMPPEISKLADNYLSRPKRIEVARPATTNTNIDQFLTLVHDQDKSAALVEVLERKEVESAIIFCNRKRGVDDLVRYLKKNNIQAAGIHGDFSQDVRMATLEKFKTGDVKLLVASDVAARGLDVQELPWVINFDVPLHPEDYVHRIGRTGRAGAKGHALTLCGYDDGKSLDGVMKLIKQEVPIFEMEGIENLSMKEIEDGSKDKRRRKRRGRKPAAATAPKAEARKEEPQKEEARTEKPETRDAEPEQKADNRNDNKAEKSNRRGRRPRHQGVHGDTSMEPRDSDYNQKRGVNQIGNIGEIPAFLLRVPRIPKNTRRRDSADS